MDPAPTEDVHTGGPSPNQTPAHLPSRAPVERCADVWFEDGNCVLQAEDTMFKVYTGLLAKYVEVFETLFKLPQPSGAGAEYEGYPLVVLQDSAKDVRWLLMALFDLQFYADVRKIKDVKIVVSVINMSLKYQVDILLRRSLVAFTALYPATLARWDIRASRRQFAPFSKAYGRALPFVAIEVAKKTGMDAVLPAAMFECCGYTIAEITDGVCSPSGQVFHLDDQARTAVLQGRATLAHDALAKKVELAYSREALSTQNRVRETPEYWDVLQQWVQETDGPDGWISPLIDALEFPTFAYSRLVRHSSARERLVIARGEAWKALPVAFGLKEWDKLGRAMVH